MYKVKVPFGFKNYSSFLLSRINYLKRKMKCSCFVVTLSSPREGERGGKNKEGTTKRDSIDPSFRWDRALEKIKKRRQSDTIDPGIRGGEQKGVLPKVEENEYV